MFTFIFQKYRNHPRVKDDIGGKGLLPFAILADVLIVLLVIQFLYPILIPLHWYH